MLESQGLIMKAIPALSRYFGFTQDETWKLLENQNGTLEKLLSRRNDSELRHRVNRWWKENRADFPKMGLGILAKAKSPSKLPEHTYDQIICLVWLTYTLRSQKIVKKLGGKVKDEKPVQIKEVKLTIWQCILNWFKNLFGGR